MSDVTTDKTSLVGPEEAAAMALAQNAAMNTQPWHEMPEYLRDGYRRAAVVALDAARPGLVTAVLCMAEQRIGEKPLPAVASHDPEYVDGYHDGATDAVTTVSALRAQLVSDSSS